jgi:hypothetical protein
VVTLNVPSKHVLKVEKRNEFLVSLPQYKTAIRLPAGCAEIQPRLHDDTIDISLPFAVYLKALKRAK